jgi:hypothetical protein
MSFRFVTRNLDSHSLATFGNRSYFLEFVLTNKNKALKIYKNKNEFYNINSKSDNDKFIKNPDDFKLIDGIKFETKPSDSNYKFETYSPKNKIFVSNTKIKSKYKTDFDKIYRRYKRYCEIHRIKSTDVKIEVDTPFEIGYMKQNDEYKIIVPKILSKDLSNSNVKELVNYVLNKYGEKNSIKTIKYIITYA